MRLYARADPLDSKDNAIFDINCKVISITPFGGGPHEAFGVAFGFDDDKKALEVDTTDGFHTYRIVKNGDVDMKVFADGDLKLTTLYKDLPGQRTRSRQFVSTSSQGASTWDIAYVSYSIFPSPV